MGTYNITAYAEPVPGETFTSNNVATALPSVGGTYFFIVTPTTGATVSGGQVYVEFGASDSENLLEIHVFVNGEFITSLWNATGSSDLIVPVFQNGTNTIELMAFWWVFQNGTNTIELMAFWWDLTTLNATVTINSIDVVPIALPSPGDYVNWRIELDLYTEDMNFTFGDWLSEFEVNVSMTLHRYDEGGTIMLGDFRMIVNVLNGYIPSTDMGWDYMHFFCFSGLQSLEVISSFADIGDAAPFFQWNDLLIVDGSTIYEGYAVWTLSNEDHMMTAYALRPTGMLVYFRSDDPFNSFEGYITETNLLPAYDTTAPVWAQDPTNQNVELGHGLSYRLTAIDPSGISTWWLNDTARFAVSADGLVTSIVSLGEGTYGLRIWVNDTLGHTLNGTFSVSVQDTLPPEWVENPINQDVELGNDLSYSLSATDPSGISMWWLNDTVRFAVSADGLVTSIVSLEEGIYGLQIWVNDTLGHTLSGTFSVSVQDTLPPEWAEDPTNQNVELGDDLSYGLTAIDPSGISTWWLNDTVRFAVSADGLVTSIVSLVEGTYGLQIWVNDTLGNTLSGTFSVSVQDTLPPEIDHPDDINYTRGQTGNSIAWHPTDALPASYEISIGGTVVRSGTWNSSSEVISISVDGLDSGTYNYTLVVTDEHGLSSSDTVIVTVSEPPTPIPPIDMTIIIIIVMGGIVVVIIVAIVIRRRRVY
jgi:hypothetical protein